MQQFNLSSNAIEIISYRTFETSSRLFSSEETVAWLQIFFCFCFLDFFYEDMIDIPPWIRNQHCCGQPYIWFDSSNTLSPNLAAQNIIAQYLENTTLHHYMDHGLFFWAQDMALGLNV